MKTTPIDKRNLKIAPTRSETAQKRAPKQRIPTQQKQRGGSCIRTRKRPRNDPIHTKRGTNAYQKGRLCIPKNAARASHTSIDSTNNYHRKTRMKLHHHNTQDKSTPQTRRTWRENAFHTSHRRMTPKATIEISQRPF